MNQEFLRVDRGYVLIKNKDGSNDIAISARVDGSRGVAHGVYARYPQARAIQLQDGVRLLSGRDYFWTDTIVEVLADKSETIFIRPVRGM